MNLFALQWDSPWIWLLLPLALLPWLSLNQVKAVAYIAVVPVDPWSQLISRGLKLLASAVMVMLIAALAEPYIPEQSIERVGQGAEVVLLLDRSRSMDEPFAVQGQRALYGARSETSRRTVSRDYLLEFIKRRPDDRFGFVFFSTRSSKLLPLTYNKEAIMAAVDAGALWRGLSETNVADALLRGAEMFEGEDYRGSRIVLLVSDGGTEIDAEEQAEIRALYERLNISIYWIYLQAMAGMTLDPSDRDNLLWTDTPERRLHEFFKTMGVPYRAFEAGSVESFAQAMDAIDSQQYQTLIVEEITPRLQRADRFLWLALLGLLALSAIHSYTYWGVQRAYD